MKHFTTQAFQRILALVRRDTPKLELSFLQQKESFRGSEMGSKNNGSAFDKKPETTMPFEVNMQSEQPSNVPKPLNSDAPQFTIREAKASDIELVISFISKKAAFDGVPQSVEVTADMMRQHLFGPHPLAFVILAEISGRVVGFATYFLTFSSFLGRPGIWLDDLFIDQDVRGNGGGKALLAFLAQLAEKRGYGRIEWTAAATNDRGLAFYQRNGARLLETTRLLRLDRASICRLARHGAA